MTPIISLVMLGSRNTRNKKIKTQDNMQKYMRFGLYGLVLLAGVLITVNGPVLLAAEASSESPDMPSSASAFDNDGSGDGFDEFDAFDDFDEFEEDEGDETKAVFDPLSGYNRVVTVVNDRLYYWVLKPVARGYGWVVPKPARQSINCFFINLGFPARFVNNVLQLKMKESSVETARFLVNTTVGVAGLWDPADVWLELPAYDEDFGQTLGHYGLGGGFHIVWPFFGPSNLRDTCGRGVDWFLSPTSYIEDDDVSLSVSAVQTINKTSLKIGQYEAMTKDALDLYVFIRDGYEQNRNKKIEE
jgi:phospholipid-binding lipoprotein MlaA